MTWVLSRDRIQRKARNLKKTKKNQILNSVDAVGGGPREALRRHQRSDHEVGEPRLRLQPRLQVRSAQTLQNNHLIKGSRTKVLFLVVMATKALPPP